MREATPEDKAEVVGALRRAATSSSWSATD